MADGSSQGTPELSAVGELKRQSIRQLTTFPLELTVTIYFRFSKKILYENEQFR